MVLAAAGSRRQVLAAAATEYQIAPVPGQAHLFGPGQEPTDVWNYNGQIPGPVLRARQGEPLQVVVSNKLDQDTTVHWHGIRLPNAMDGVPGLTQPPIKPGESFTYEFTPPDAGTFWYHPHANSLQQLGRGLAGALIIEEPEPVAVDRDILWVLTDWRLKPNKQLATGFGNMMDAGMAGRVGNTVTLNGTVPADQPVRAGERIRLRLLNAALARIMALRFDSHRPVIVAIDGQPCEPHEPEGGRLLLGPAMRIDVMIDMQGDPGQRYAVTDDFYQDLAYTLTNLSYSEDAPVRAHPLETPLQLPRNPTPEPDLVAAEHHDITLQGGMMGGGMMTGMGGMNGMAMPGMDGGAVWAINGMSMTGDGQSGMQPLLTLQRGKSYILTIRNQTAWWHPMHLHGHSFRVVSRNGVAVPHHQWSDTVLVPPKETVDCAFVADNPGDWMLHCHVMDHQVSGLMTVLRVA
ncbi:MAG: multicopper oxidase family protein [Rhodospirillaceae bacterium]|nr:MAG: multicopper oxidase family protein [Rhodospirillaceae bacterium]